MNIIPSYIAPNPKEVDYWVDLKTDPYGGCIKYYDGFLWVNLINSELLNSEIGNQIQDIQETLNKLISENDCYKHVFLEQEEYDNLTQYDKNTIYMIYEPMDWQFVDKPTDTFFVYDDNVHTLVSTDGYDVIGQGGSEVGVYTFIVKLKFGYKWSDGTDDDLQITYTITQNNQWKFGMTFPIIF